MPPDLPDNRTDAEIYAAMKAGQPSALGILYDRYSAFVYGIAIKTLSNPQEAEDLLQDVFLSLTRTNSYDPKRGSLKTYLAVLTRSRGIDRIRSRNSSVSFLARLKPNTPEATPNVPLEEIFRTEQSEAVQSALTQLSEAEQQLLQLAYYEGLSQSEIADRLSLPLGTVKTRTRRSLLKLRQILTEFL
ncbi:sigma-70 family RNA polymerase sigma factor [Leptolyngbya sp. NIES-2104]|uniref:sigma-70 family RNA polymerase sigma factor n=1 Tax=Leptolyngbya sp. NIES-2104 TaxID=1552121 RepID=UPI0006ECBAC6|nr:sigma-70 family RNA polymerase sigma factor [Leptolyngbya sp. NIES-2104]GAP95329.1 RNA polymerase sigma-70 factor [Leptolyngbya sp. NIES-2104]